MADWLYPVLGSGVLLVLALDVFQTAFHAAGRGGPINRRQNRLIWTVVRRMATVGGRTRGGILSLGGPIMAVATMGGWTLLLLGGFTLIYLPFIHGFHFSPGQPGPALVEAFYYSGIIAGTLGQGDVVAAGAPLRVVTVLESLAGFALVTVAVTYVLAVYREIIRTQTLAVALHARLTGSGADTTPIRQDPGWARSVSLRIAHTLEAHFNYPILHYFRPGRASRALPPQLALLRESLTGPDGPPRPGADPATHASALALDATVSRYIGEVHSLFIEQRAEPVEDPDREEARLADILREMAYE